MLLSLHATPIEAIHVLDSGEEVGGVGFEQDEDKHWHEVVGCWHGLVASHAQKVHDGLRAFPHTGKLVLRGLQQEITRRNEEMVLGNSYYL
jgi:hypothetical protein